MSTRAITPASFPWFDYSRYSFSLGLMAGDKAFLSGHSASQYDGERDRIVVDGDMTQQARTAYAKIERILEGAGKSFQDVTRVVENVTIAGIDDYAAVEAVRAEVFGDTRPAVNTVVVHRLLRPDALIEIEATAGGASRPLDAPISRPGFAAGHVTDGTVYLSTIHPYDDEGQLVGRGDLVAQVRQIFKNASRILKSAGLTTSNIVKTLEMISPAGLADYRSTAAVRKEYLGPVYPGAAGILQDRVATDPDILVSYDFIASKHPAIAINPGWSRYEKLTYSPAVKAGGMLFMSGQAALDPETERAVHVGDVVGQTEFTYRNIITVLEAAGLGPADLVKTVEYVTPTGLERYRETAAVRKLLLADPYPASTGIVCHSLLRPEFEIEIDPMAIYPEED